MKPIHSIHDLEKLFEDDINYFANNHQINAQVQFINGKIHLQGSIDPKHSLSETDNYRAYVFFKKLIDIYTNLYQFFFYQWKDFQSILIDQDLPLKAYEKINQIFLKPLKENHLTRASRAYFFFEKLFHLPSSSVMEYLEGISSVIPDETKVENIYGQAEGLGYTTDFAFIKYTKILSEAQAYQHIKLFQDKISTSAIDQLPVAHFYDVCQLESKFKDFPIYRVVMEKLKVPELLDVKIEIQTKDIISDRIISLEINSRSFDHSLEEFLISDLKNYYGIAVGGWDREVMNTAKIFTISPEFKQIYQNLKDSYLFLKKLGISVVDFGVNFRFSLKENILTGKPAFFHNVMQKYLGQYVIIDFGGGSQAAPIEIPHCKTTKLSQQLKLLIS